MRRIAAVITFVVVLCLTSPILGEVEIGSLIINRTVTRFGQEFHRHFVSMWEAPRDIEDYNILIRERASARWGSMILIYVNDRLIYRNILGIRTQQMEEIVRKSVELTRGYLFRLSISKQMFENEQDIARDGL